MPSELFVRSMLYLSLTVVGVPGNVAVIMAFLLLLYRENRLLPADAIVLHLACANLLVVGVRCLLETLESFYVTKVLTDVGCKTVIFVYRTSRSLSIWLTFVLSTYQCLSISPPGSRWASLRALFAKYLGLVFFCLWLINTCMSSAAILFSFGSQNASAQHGINVQFCYVYFPSKLSIQANGAGQVGRDVVPMVLMTLASLIILIFLYKHSRHVKGLRGGTGGGGGAEQRAAKSVVALVTLYVVLYGVDNGIWVYTLTAKKAMKSAFLSDLRIFFSSLYAALSPLVIIVSNRKVHGQLRCLKTEKPIEKATTLSTM
ncbi:olfactory receptor class A related 2 [Eucyclogobius newberryi]|uniref:olfactory receptor class A related 2 n=1 Tax=Eucyclogobius newberryi TaxID=166745 RepID=UPI003B5B5384